MTPWLRSGGWGGGTPFCTYYKTWCQFVVISRAVHVLPTTPFVKESEAISPFLYHLQKVKSDCPPELRLISTVLYLEPNCPSDSLSPWKNYVSSLFVWLRRGRARRSVTVLYMAKKKQHEERLNTAKGKGSHSRGGPGHCKQRPKKMTTCCSRDRVQCYTSEPRALQATNLKRGEQKCCCVYCYKTKITGKRKTAVPVCKRLLRGLRTAPPQLIPLSIPKSPKLYAKQKAKYAMEKRIPPDAGAGSGGVGGGVAGAHETKKRRPPIRFQTFFHTLPP